MAWRLAKALETLRTQVNKLHPNRSKVADGTIGDAAHASRTSDHNPWVKDGSMGVVTALDITHDPKNGVDTYAMAEYLRQKRDARIKYVISNKRTFSSTTQPWTWRAYTGSNPHASHIHISVKSDKAHYDNTKPWDLPTSQNNPAASPAGPETTRPILRRGDKGDAVKTVQSIVKVVPDGDFGPLTENAVKAFQRNHKLVADGIVGPLTWAALDKYEPE